MAVNVFPIIIIIESKIAFRFFRNLSEHVLPVNDGGHSHVLSFMHTPLFSQLGLHTGL